MTMETILIVEDNTVLREGLREMLSLEGFRILTAAHGRDALQQMGLAAPDLILSDIAMPEMDGYEFFKAVRSRQEWVTIPFIFLTARADLQDVLTGKNMGAEDYLIKPLSREELVTAVRARLNRSQQIRMVQLQKAYEASLTVLANAIDLRDRYTRGHVERVTAYTLVIGKNLKWPEWRIDQLRFGAILHDIGKIFVRESTLLKANALTPEEWDEIRQHPVNGAEMVRDIPYLAPAAPLIRHHHERWDGTGYPDQLAGDAIPLGARIINLTDSFDAMTTVRPYYPGRSLEEAHQEILRHSGAQFDPQVVEAFCAAWDSGQIQHIAGKKYTLLHP